MQSTIVTLSVGVLAAIAAWHLKPERKPPPPEPPVVSVQEMGSLTTLRVNYSNVIEFTDKLTQDIPLTQWELRLGGTTVLLVARGDCYLGTDLRGAKYEQVSPEDKTATLSLPTPTLISARLNHDPKTGGSRFYTATSKGIAALIPGGEMQTKATNEALEKGQKDIEKACAGPEYLTAARNSAEVVLKPVVSATGWKIKIVWR